MVRAHLALMKRSLHHDLVVWYGNNYIGKRVGTGYVVWKGGFEVPYIEWSYVILDETWWWPKVPKRVVSNCLTFCWPCISVCLSQYLTNLMHKICFTISLISCLYMFRAHVLIIRRSNLHYTASGIITPIGGRLLQETRGCVMQFWPPDDEHMCSKHVEAWNKTYCETNFVHQVG